MTTAAEPHNRTAGTRRRRHTKRSTVAAHFMTLGRGRQIGDAAVVLEGGALAVVVGADGPAPWPAVRAVVAIALTAAVVLVRSRTGRRRRHAATLAFGVIGLIVGVGIGMPHLVRAGASTESVAGVVALASGLGLVACSTAALVGLARRWRKLLVVPIGIGVVILIVAPLTLATAVTNVPPLESGDARPADVGLAYEDVSFEASDGVRLAAWYVPSTNGAAIVLLGGATNVRSDELDHAVVLARHGYGVLLMDARGHGESEGDAMLWGWYGDTDVRAAIDYLRSRPDLADAPIGAIGMSMGAEEAIGAAAADPRLGAVVAEGASARGPADEGTTLSGIDGWLMRYIDRTTTSAADLMTSAHRPIRLRDAVAAAAPRPMLIIAAGQQPTEIDAAHAFRAASPSSVEVWIAPDTGHTEASRTHPAEWERRVVTFLDRSLRPDARTGQ